MDHCPTEIHSYIIRVACGLDDGKTARAICATSSYFRSMAIPFRFLCLSISGFDHLSAVVKLVEAAHEDPAISTPVVEHLFLSDRDLEYTCDDWHRRVFPFGVSSATVMDAQRLFIILNNKSQRFTQLVPQLFQLVAPTLRTCTLLAYDQYRSPVLLQTVLCTKWPRLEELTLRGNAWEVDAPSAMQFNEMLMPQLERVHLSEVRAYKRLLRQVCAAASGPPTVEENDTQVTSPNNLPPNKITHIRLSGLARDPDFACRIHSELHAQHSAPATILNLPSKSDNEPFLVAPHFSWKPILGAEHLQSLLIQPCRLPPLTDCTCCSGYTATEEMQHVFREVSRADHKLIYVHPIKEGEAYCYAQAQDDWLARIAGREGCWISRGTDEYEEDVELRDCF